MFIIIVSYCDKILLGRACAALSANVAGRIGNMDSVQLSQHF